MPRTKKKINYATETEEGAKPFAREWAGILRLRSRCMIPEISAAECAVLARLLEDLCD